MKYKNEQEVLESIDDTLKKILMVQMYAIGVENHVDLTFEYDPTNRFGSGQKVVAKNEKGKRLSKAKLAELMKNDPYAYNFYMNNGYLPEDEAKYHSGGGAPMQGNGFNNSMYGGNMPGGIYVPMPGRKNIQGSRNWLPCVFPLFLFFYCYAQQISI